MLIIDRHHHSLVVVARVKHESDFENLMNDIKISGKLITERSIPTEEVVVISTLNNDFRCSLTILKVDLFLN